MQSARIKLGGRHFGNTFAHEAASRRRQQWRREAQDLWAMHACEPLFVVGIGLYWGQGAKRVWRSTRNLRLALSNSDPKLVSVWLRWCHECIPELPLSLWLHVHDNVDRDAAAAFWRAQVRWKGPVSITEVVSIASKRVKPPYMLPHGTAHVVAGCGGVEAACNMLEWIELAAQAYQ